MSTPDIVMACLGIVAIWCVFQASLAVTQSVPVAFINTGAYVVLSVWAGYAKEQGKQRSKQGPL